MTWQSPPIRTARRREPMPDGLFLLLRVIEGNRQAEERFRMLRRGVLCVAGLLAVFALEVAVWRMV